MDAFPTMVSVRRGQVTTANQTLEVIKGAEVDLEYLKFAKFMKTNLLAFQGNFKLNEVKGWIEALERIFSVLSYTALQKVTFTTYILEVDAKAQ